MSIMAAPVRATPISRANAVAKMTAALILTATLVLSIDPVSAAVALAIELIALPFAGLGVKTLLARTSVVWLAAFAGGFATLFFGVDSGATVLDLQVVRISEGSAMLAAAICLRVLAVALPGVVLFATTDPTDLADGMIQRLGLPARFVLGALAALRLVGLLIDDWQSLAMARRARGVGGGMGIKRFAGQAFALLVMSLRRGSQLATAMEARGFGTAAPRTSARVSTFAARDAVLVGGAALVAALAVTAANLAGTWNFIFT
ncbi:energy-coupling factor transporter transmembrane component T family protein [Spelaeicoccus albus]|uniref:Energy-coupling factor transport system permease protein n=1 Tax=Spelaeicoccus albus TaxID=1280376 RepID=A0A7Z0ABT2_9MICO|nr:energy-coupling factor transporter transmembrane component T [Spelaeicoccus albus]NYI66261.1 energy-coupling factor transport system permease protein [Spelaeicoccus albus]